MEAGPGRRRHHVPALVSWQTLDPDFTPARYGSRVQNASWNSQIVNDIPSRRRHIESFATSQPPHPLSFLHIAAAMRSIFSSLALFMSCAEALYFFIEGPTQKCFFEELPKDTLVVGEYGRLETAALVGRVACMYAETPE